MILYLLLIFLVPVAGYCLVLAVLNRRDRPLMVSGVWDFVGVLLAASGFLLVAGPAIVANLQDRDLWAHLMAGSAGSLRSLGVVLIQWWGIWVLYYLALLGGSAILLHWQRRKTGIYNVQPQDFDGLFTDVLEHLGVGTQRSGERLLLLRDDQPAEAVTVEPFAAMCHVTLHWSHADGPIRRQIERELVRRLPELQTPDNPAGGWFLTVAACLFGLIIMISVLLILSMLLAPRRW